MRQLIGDMGYVRIKHLAKLVPAAVSFYRRAARISAAHSDTLGAIYRRAA
jgi:hypothetical protein